MTGKKDERAINRLSEQEEKIIEQIRKIDYGEIRVVVNGGQPTRLEEVKKSIKL